MHDGFTTHGAGVDGSVIRIGTAYNNQGLPYLLTSYADTAGTQIVNQVENVYNGLGQLTQQYQAVTGAVDTSSTPSVQYTYSDPSTGSSGFAKRAELVSSGAVERKEVGG